MPSLHVVSARSPKIALMKPFWDTKQPFDQRQRVLKEAGQWYGDRYQQRRRLWRRAMPNVASCHGILFWTPHSALRPGFKSTLGQNFPGKRFFFDRLDNFLQAQFFLYRCYTNKPSNLSLSNVFTCSIGLNWVQTKMNTHPDWGGRTAFATILM